MRNATVHCLLVTTLVAGLPLCSVVQAADPVRFDFVDDRPFPENAKKKREFADSMRFDSDQLAVSVTAENEFGGSVQVSRRGPGGLGVRGNGDRNAAGEGTTSGNRVNNGEDLIFHFTSPDGSPVEVVLVSIEFDRVVHDDENFPDTGLTRYQVSAGGTVLGSGELDVDAGAQSVDFGETVSISSFRVSNDQPFHPIANRFRVSAISVMSSD